MTNTENTALQMIAEAARCPDYGPDMVKALMEKLDMNEKGFALLMNVAPSTVRAAMRNGQAAHADLRDRAGDRRQDCRRAAAGRREESINGTSHNERGRTSADLLRP